MSNNFKSVLFLSILYLIFILKIDVGAHCFTFCFIHIFSTEYIIIAV